METILVEVDTYKIIRNPSEQAILDKAGNTHIVIGEENLGDILMFDEPGQNIIKDFFRNNGISKDEEQLLDSIRD